MTAEIDLTNLDVPSSHVILNLNLNATLVVDVFPSLGSVMDRTTVLMEKMSLSSVVSLVYCCHFNPFCYNYSFMISSELTFNTISCSKFIINLSLLKATLEVNESLDNSGS